MQDAVAFVLAPANLTGTLGLALQLDTVFVVVNHPPVAWLDRQDSAPCTRAGRRPIEDTADARRHGRPHVRSRAFLLPACAVWRRRAFHLALSALPPDSALNQRRRKSSKCSPARGSFGHHGGGRDGREGCCQALGGACWLLSPCWRRRHVAPWETSPLVAPWTAVSSLRSVVALD